MHPSNDKCNETVRGLKQRLKTIRNLTNFDVNGSTEANVSCQGVEIDSKELVSSMQTHPNCIEFTSLNKRLAIFCLENDRETEGIFHLIESHAVLLHLLVQHRYNKTKEREILLQEEQIFGLNSAHIQFNAGDNSQDCVYAVKKRLSEFPKEWYMVQLTTQDKSSEKSIFNTTELTGMLPIHISVLPTGNNGIDPICVTVPEPKITTGYNICKEIEEILSSNKSILAKHYMKRTVYWKMREEQNNKMKTAVAELETTWLREWRVLLIADPVEESSLVKDVRDMINKLIADNKSSKRITRRTRWLLHKIALGSCFLTRTEIARAIKYVLPSDDKLSENIILSIYGKLNALTPLIDIERKTLVLIVDEILDHIPFEMMKILQCQPVTRFPSMHMAYALYKEHEDTIENGCKVIEIGKNNGSFIVNPSGDLPCLEKRMKVFMDYWLPHWKGSYNTEPDEKSFECALTNFDILMYSGHGSGIQFLSGERIEKLRVKAIVLLFGCSSAKLWTIGGRFPPIGVSNQYLIACSPCILGMLWEVTDCEVDKLTANFMGNWLPSPASVPWSNVNIDEWTRGKLIFKDAKLEDKLSSLSLNDTKQCNKSVEPEMLRALAKARGTCAQYMTQAAVVVRGLPIRLKPT